MIQRYHIHLTALTPIVHGDTTTSIDMETNTTLFMRRGTVVNDIPIRVPAISENALRSVMVRIPLHDHLLQALAIERGQLSQAVVNLLFSGGNLKSGATAPDSALALGHQIGTRYPSLALLGGAVDRFMLPPGRLALSAWIVARENLPALAEVAPELVEPAERVSLFDLIHEETRTRGTGEQSAGNQMLYTYETLAAGAQVLVEVTLRAHTPPVVASALAVALAQWDGYLGAQGRQGRGRMRVRHTLPPADLYLEHLEQEREAMRAGLLDGTLGTGREVVSD